MTEGAGPIRRELIQLFQHVLERRDAGFLFKDLKKEFIVLSTNIITLRKHIFAAPSDDLVEALVNSCAIPLVFRGAKEVATTPYVDGGLCENLPSGELSRDTARYGEIIAMSFPNVVDGAAPATTMKFVYELFSAAINNSVERARAQLPQHSVLMIPSEIGTLQFKGAFSLKARAAEFEVIERRAADWLERNIDDKGRASVYPHNEAAASLMADLYDWYMASQSKVGRRSIRNVLAVKAHSLAPGNDPKETIDQIQKLYDFAPTDTPLSAILIGIGAEEQQSLVKHRVRVRTPEGDEVRTRVLPVIDRKATKGEVYGYLVLFEPSLPPMSNDEFKRRGPYRAIYEAEIKGGMVSLALLGEDAHAVSNTRDETFERIEIVMLAPEGFRYRAIPSLTLNGVKKQGAAEMTETELRNSVGDGTLGFSVFGWKAENFVCGSVLKVDLFRIGRSG